MVQIFTCDKDNLTRRARSNLKRQLAFFTHIAVLTTNRSKIYCSISINIYQSSRKVSSSSAFPNVVKQSHAHILCNIQTHFCQTTANLPVKVQRNYRLVSGSFPLCFYATNMMVNVYILKIEDIIFGTTLVHEFNIWNMLTVHWKSIGISKRKKLLLVFDKKNSIFYKTELKLK